MYNSLGELYYYRTFNKRNVRIYITHVYKGVISLNAKYILINGLLHYAKTGMKVLTSP